MAARTSTRRFLPSDNARRAISRLRLRARLTPRVCPSVRSGSHLSVATVATRSRAPFFVVSGALFVLLLAGNLPTPLYAVYRARFGFSGTELTLIFAVYAMALIPSLLVFGQLSDRVGRKRVIAGGLCAAAIGLALLAVAQSTTWLFVA